MVHMFWMIMVLREGIIFFSRVQTHISMIVHMIRVRFLILKIASFVFMYSSFFMLNWSK